MLPTTHGTDKSTRIPQRVVPYIFSFEMTWAVIGFSHSHHIVCEDAGHLHIALERTGQLNGTAQVDYKLRSMSAKAGLDYELLDHSRSVSFQPGKHQFGTKGHSSCFKGCSECNHLVMQRHFAANLAVARTRNIMVIDDCVL